MKFTIGLLIVLLHTSITHSSIQSHPIFKTLESINELNSKESKDAKKVFAYFWATWCTSCKVKLTTTLPKFQKENPDIKVITVNLDEDKKRAQHFLKKRKITLPVLFDNKNELIEKLSIKAVPYWITYSSEDESSSWKSLDQSVALNLNRVKKSFQIDK